MSSAVDELRRGNESPSTEPRPPPGEHVKPDSRLDGDDEVPALARELRALCRGRGVLATDLRDRLGPPASPLLAGGRRPGRHRSARRTERTARHRARGPPPGPPHLGPGVALGLHPDADSPFLGDRLQWLVRRLEREERTVRRRLDEAMTLLAETLVADDGGSEMITEAPSDRWYLRSVSTLVSLDGAEPEVFEQRKIVSTTRALTALTVAMSVYHLADEALSRRVKPQRSLWRAARPLRAAERQSVPLRRRVAVTGRAKRRAPVLPALPATSRRRDATALRAHTDDPLRRVPAANPVPTARAARLAVAGPAASNAGRRTQHRTGRRAGSSRRSRNMDSRIFASDTPTGSAGDYGLDPDFGSSTRQIVDSDAVEKPDVRQAENCPPYVVSASPFRQPGLEPLHGSELGGRHGGPHWMDDDRRSGWPAGRRGRGPAPRNGRMDSAAESALISAPDLRRRTNFREAPAGVRTSIPQAAGLRGSV